MRLRRETGDFQIKINSENAVNTIRKGLSAEDFVGELVNVNGTYEVVNSANDTETGAEFKTNSFTLTYTKATGVITAQEGGSGSGSGGVNEIINLDELEKRGQYSWQYETGLSKSDFVNACICNEGNFYHIQSISEDNNSNIVLGMSVRSDGGSVAWNMYLYSSSSGVIWIEVGA